MLLIIGAACSQEPTEVLAGDAGEKLFDASCAACHGDGSGGPSMADLRALSSEQLREGLRDHPTAGDLLERLSAADIGNLVEYLEE